MLMSKIGYKGTLLLGLAVAGIGFVINSFGINAAISAGSNVYIVFLLSMCIVAMGVVMLQNVANPYVMVLGKPGERRLPHDVVTGAELGGDNCCTYLYYDRHHRR